MLLYISLFGIFLSVILLYFNARNYASSMYLGVYFILVCLYGIIQYVLLWSKSVFWVSLFCTNFAFALYAAGPLSYIYIRSVLTDSARLRKKDIWHLVPLIVYLLAALPYMLSSYSFKTEIAQSIVADPGFLGGYHFTILSDWFSVPVVYLSRPLLAFGYTIASGIMLYKHFKSHKNIDGPAAERFVRRWLITFTGFQLLLFVSHIFYLLGSFGIASNFLFLSITLLNLISSIGLIGLIISPILFPRILYGLPHFTYRGYTDTPEVNEKKDIAPKKEALYDNNYMYFIKEKLDDRMNKHQLYLQKDLNLPQLSVLLNIPTHHLAYFFSGFLGMTFNDYRNAYRVEHAKRLILDQETTRITLEAIGLLSGFSNRNTFSKVFKEMEGLTPSAFAEQYNR